MVVEKSTALQLLFVVFTPPRAPLAGETWRGPCQEPATSRQDYVPSASRWTVWKPSLNRSDVEDDNGKVRESMRLLYVPIKVGRHATGVPQGPVPERPAGELRPLLSSKLRPRQALSKTKTD